MMTYINDSRRLLDNLNTGFREMALVNGSWVTVAR